MYSMSLTIRKDGNGWFVEGETSEPTLAAGNRVSEPLKLDVRAATQFPVRVLDELRAYGRMLGEAVFVGDIRAIFHEVLDRVPHGDVLHVSLSVEDVELRLLRWERLCCPLHNRKDSPWEFLHLCQKTAFSLDLRSANDRRYPAISRVGLKALVVVADMGPTRPYKLADFNASETVAGIRTALGKDIACHVLASSGESQLPNTDGLPTLDEICRWLTRERFAILHLVCHGEFKQWEEPGPDGKPVSKSDTFLYLRKPGELDPTRKDDHVARVSGTDFLRRLRQLQALPHLTFLCSCSSASTEAEQGLGGLGQRLVRELAMPAVVAMTEPIPIDLATEISKEFYNHLRQTGEVDRALTKASASQAGRPAILVPTHFSRLAGRRLFDDSLELTTAEWEHGLNRLPALVQERAPVLAPTFEKILKVVQPALEIWRNSERSDQDKRTEDEKKAGATLLARKAELNELCQDFLENSFDHLAKDKPLTFPTFDGRCPFPGLGVFDKVTTGGKEEDFRPFFFGRDPLIREIRELLNRNRFVAVLGGSGSGKSSLIRAGLLEAIRREKPELQAIVFPPGKDPLVRLQTELAAIPNPDILVVDQFEELFTLCADLTQRKDFLKQLLPLKDRIPIVITMRADFLGECAGHDDLHQLLDAAEDKHLKLIQPLKGSELRSVMKQQAEAVGLKFEPGLAASIFDDLENEPGAMPLLQHCLRQLWQHRHGRWLRLTEYANEERVGGVKRAISRTAEDVYQQLVKEMPEASTLLPFIFERLARIDTDATEPEERRDTRRREELSELTPSGSNAQLVKRIVTKLADEKLVVTTQRTKTHDSDPGDLPLDKDNVITEVEVAHEALIRNWQQLKDWLDAARDTARLVERIRNDADNYNKQPTTDNLTLRGSVLAEAEALIPVVPRRLNEPEEQFIRECRKHEHALKDAKVRSRNRIIVVLACGLVVAAGLSVFAGRQWSAANTANSQLNGALSSVDLNQRLATSLYLTQVGASRLENDPLSALSLAVMAMEQVIGENVPPQQRCLPDGQTEAFLQTCLDRIPVRPVSGSGKGDVHFFNNRRHLLFREDSGRTYLIDRQVDNPIANRINLGVWPETVTDVAADPNGTWICIAVPETLLLHVIFLANPLKRVELPVEHVAKGRWWCRQVTPDGKLAVLHYLKDGAANNDVHPNDKVLLLSTENQQGRILDIQNSGSSTSSEYSVSGDLRWIATSTTGGSLLWHIADSISQPHKLEAQSVLQYSPDSNWLTTTDGRSVEIASLSSELNERQTIRNPRMRTSDDPAEDADAAFGDVVAFRNDSQMMLIDEFVYTLVHGHWKLLGGLSLAPDTSITSEMPRFLAGSSYLYLKQSGQLWHVETDREKPIFERCRLSPNEQWVYAYLPDDVTKVVSIGTSPQSLKEIWVGKAYGEHARIPTLNWLNAPNEFAVSSSSDLVFFPESASILVRLEIDLTKSEAKSENLYFSRTSDPDVNIANVRISPHNKWLIVSTRQSTFVCSTTKPVRQEYLELDTKQFPHEEAFTFDSAERFLVYNMNNVISAFPLDPYWYKYATPFVHIDTPFAISKVVSGSYDAELFSFAWDDKAHIWRYLDVVHCNRRDVFDSAFQFAPRPETVSSWLGPYGTGTSSRRWISPDGKRLIDVDVDDDSIFVADVATFSDLPAQSSPTTLREYRASTLENPLWSADGRFCFIADETEGRLGGITLQNSNPEIQTLEFWTPEIRNEVELARDKNRGAYHFPVRKVHFRQDRVDGLWQVDGGYVVANGVLTVSDRNPRLNSLQCNFVKMKSSHEDTTTYLEPSSAYLVLPSWSVITQNGVQELPQECRPPTTTSGIKRVREMAVANSAQGVFIPAVEVKLTGTPGLKGVCWDSIWRTDGGGVKRIWKASSPLVSHQVEISANGESVWYLTESGEIKQFSFAEGVNRSEDIVVWRIADFSKITGGLFRFHVSPGEKWLVWESSRELGVRIRSCSTQFPKPIEHTLFSTDYGDSEASGFPAIRFVNDELLVIKQAMVRMGAHRDEISCVKLSGAIGQVSHDGKRVAVESKSRVHSVDGATRKGFSVYSCDVSELLHTAKLILGRPPTEEEREFVRRSKR
jgi:hypothetical protein